jgi:hypothetical protein
MGVLEKPVTFLVLLVNKFHERVTARKTAGIATTEVTELILRLVEDRDRPEK